MRQRNLPAATLAVAGALVLLVLIYLGSLGLANFDSALIGYAVAVVFATAALIYRYAIWIMKPPTWRYFSAGWREFLSFRNFRRYTLLIPIAWWTDIFGQTFIAHRSRLRWVMHMSIFWGVVLSLAITLPLTFGWIAFTLVPPNLYQLWVFGLPLLVFPVEAGTGFAIFHALNFTAALLIVGVGIALWRRITDLGLMTTQRFGFDLMPLVLLLAIAVTGMMLTASSLWWEGNFYWFISLTHQVVVVSWLLSIPFGKFFHIIQRPASIGVTLYQTVNQDMEHYRSGPEEMPDRCPRCHNQLPSAQFIADLKGSLRDLNQDYELEGGRGQLQDYCPTCKRALRATAYYQLMGKRFL